MHDTTDRQAVTSARGRLRSIPGEHARTLALYGGAAVAYITLGVLVPALLFSWFEGLAFLLVTVWLLPRLLRFGR